MGEILPLHTVVAFLTEFQTQLTNTDSEWDLLYYLREVCLGRSIEREQRNALAEAGLLNRDGSLDPAMRGVALAAIRGEGRTLHLESRLYFHR